MADKVNERILIYIECRVILSVAEQEWFAFNKLPIVLFVVIGRRNFTFLFFFYDR